MNLTDSFPPAIIMGGRPISISNQNEDVVIADLVNKVRQLEEYVE